MDQSEFLVASDLCFGIFLADTCFINAFNLTIFVDHMFIAIPVTAEGLRTIFQ